jgi:RimJ/RimL family protein N-acetyltransferase
MIDIHLREVVDDDYAILFEFRRDPVSAWTAAFGTQDAHAGELAARWKRSLAERSTTARVVVSGGTVVGFVATFIWEAKPQVTYWVARSHWGRGIASAALSKFLEEVTARPVYASAAKDNLASLRVLEKCGFTICGSAKSFAPARGEEIDEIFLRLR